MKNLSTIYYGLFETGSSLRHSGRFLALRSGMYTTFNIKESYFYFDIPKNFLEP